MNYKTAASFIVVSGLVTFLLAFVMDPRVFMQIVNDGVAQPHMLFLVDSPVASSCYTAVLV